jgi:hypothetical protein
MQFLPLLAILKLGLSFHQIQGAKEIILCKDQKKEGYQMYHITKPEIFA